MGKEHYFRGYNRENAEIKRLRERVERLEDSQKRNFSFIYEEFRTFNQKLKELEGNNGEK
jgi:hypothetical protein